MRNARLPLGRAAAIIFSLFLLFSFTAAHAQERPRLRVDDYDITAELTPSANKLSARAKVRFTALDDINTATFELHNGLRPTKITDAAGKALSAERVTQDSTIRISLPAGLAKDAATTLTIDYEGVLKSADDSPVEGLKLAYVGEPVSYLLYAGRWFPMSNYGINRFTASIAVTVPLGFKVVGSGSGTTSNVKNAAGKSTYTFNWEKPSFPGTIIAGQFVETASNAGGMMIRTYLTPAKKEFSASVAETAAKQFEFYSSLYGPSPSSTLNVVELPDDAVPSAWGPEIAAVASRAIGEKLNYRLLANSIAHQWWGISISPVTRDDRWMTEGFARYSEVRYVENVAGRAGMEEATKDMSTGAMAYDNIPLSNAGRMDPFSPEFQSLATDKGGMVLHMLRWVMGDANFDRAMKQFFASYFNKPVSVEDFRKVAEQVHGEALTSFFAQWLDGTGAPEFKNKYSVYRIKNGFRVVGEISQDLDLFRMPLEVRVDTDGQSEMKRIEVVGTKSPYTIETFGKPRKITLDPNNFVLKNSSDLKVRVAILRGQQAVAQGDFTEALKEYRTALESNSSSSLAHYRVAEVFFLQRNYQASANAYRESLNGDGEPRWTEVWSHIQLGKIFDVTGQRERATNEYRQALQTNDNTQGALDEARRHLETPYKREAVK